MNWLRRNRPPRPPKHELAAELRNAGTRLTGWTVRGTGLGRSLDGLILEAAAEIDRLNDLHAIKTIEGNNWALITFRPDQSPVLLLRVDGREDVGRLIDGVAHMVDSTHRDAAPLLARLQKIYADLKTEATCG